MRWIKRNLFLVVGVVLAVGLLAGAIFYLISRIKTNQTYVKRLRETTTEYARVMALAPFPSDENISLARQEVARLAAFMTNVQSQVTYPLPAKLSNQEFSSYLLNTVAELQKGAEQSGVLLPARYGFTFDALREQINFDAASIEPLSLQITDIKELCQILFRSQVHRIESLRRVRVSPLDPAQGPQYIPEKAVNTNAYSGLATVTPYEVTFTGFSTELAAVLAQLQSSPIFFAVKALDVDTLPVSAPPTEAPKQDTKAKASGKAAPPAPKDELILFAKPLRVTLFLEVVRLNQPAR